MMKAGPRRVGVKWGTIVLPIAILACGPRLRVDVPADPSRKGLSSVRPVTEPTRPSGAPQRASDTITPAYPSSDNAPPEYPTVALRAGCLGGTIPLRVYVGVDGNVAAQRDIPGRPVPADACHVAFLGAVEAAVAHWKFAPAFRLTRVTTPDDRMADRAEWQQAPIVIYLDFEFRFEVVDGKGVALTPEGSGPAR